MHIDITHPLSLITTFIRVSITLKEQTIQSIDRFSLRFDYWIIDTTDTVLCR